MGEEIKRDQAITPIEKAGGKSISDVNSSRINIDGKLKPEPVKPKPFVPKDSFDNIKDESTSVTEIFNPLAGKQEAHELFDSESAQADRARFLNVAFREEDESTSPIFARDEENEDTVEGDDKDSYSITQKAMHDLDQAGVIDFSAPKFIDEMRLASDLGIQKSLERKSSFDGMA